MPTTLAPMHIQLEHSNQMERYYRFHAGIYDATRWAFLFGRDYAIDKIAQLTPPVSNIFEIGCGTGYNLRELHKKLPKAQLTACDISGSMLRRAKRSTRHITPEPKLIQAAYGIDPVNVTPDVILLSYCLTMVNPGWQQLILQAKEDLKTDGHIVVVDFHDSPSSGFKTWMSQNHVRMKGEILPFLQEHFSLNEFEVKPAFGGLWRYFVYVGRVKGQNENLINQARISQLDPEAVQF